MNKERASPAFQTFGDLRWAAGPLGCMRFYQAGISDHQRDKFNVSETCLPARHFPTSMLGEIETSVVQSIHRNTKYEIPQVVWGSGT
jgi:hypothetical protein